MKNRYMVNVIPCNTNTLSKKGQARIMSADDLDEKLKEAEEVKPPKVVAIFKEKDAAVDKLAQKHLMMIASKTKALSRKAEKNKSSRF